MKEKYPRAAQYYDISVTQDADTGKATASHWKRITPIADTLPGVYCLRTNQDQWDETTLWHTYNNAESIQCHPLIQ